jgi:hypothetical protein
MTLADWIVGLTLAALGCGCFALTLYVALLRWRLRRASSLLWQCYHVMRNAADGAFRNGVEHQGADEGDFRAGELLGETETFLREECEDAYFNRD